MERKSGGGCKPEGTNKGGGAYSGQCIPSPANFSHYHGIYHIVKAAGKVSDNHGAEQRKKQLEGFPSVRFFTILSSSLFLYAAAFGLQFV